jgi:hypothetical protein
MGMQVPTPGHHVLVKLADPVDDRHGVCCSVPLRAPGSGRDWPLCGGLGTRPAARRQAKRLAPD